MSAGDGAGGLEAGTMGTGVTGKKPASLSIHLLQSDDHGKSVPVASLAPRGFSRSSQLDDNHQLGATAATRPPARNETPGQVSDGDEDGQRSSQSAKANHQLASDFIRLFFLAAKGASADSMDQTALKAKPLLY